MKNNHRITNIEKILVEQQVINRRHDGSINDLKAMIRRHDKGMAEFREMQLEYARAMVKHDAELVKVNKRLDAHLEEEKKFRIDSERRFQVFYSRLVKLDHRNGKNGKNR